jgi:hypothetical protein
MLPAMPVNPIRALMSSVKQKLQAFILRIFGWDIGPYS